MLFVESKLKFDKHVAKICHKVSQLVAVLKRRKKVLVFQIPMKLHQAYIVPCFHYCAETWHFCSKYVSNKLEKINKRALHFVHQDNSSPYEMLLNWGGQQTLSNQRLAMILTTVNKVVNKQNVLTFIL